MAALDELTTITATKDATTGHLTGLSGTRAPTEQELQAVYAADRLAALEAAMAKFSPQFRAPSLPQGYKAPALPPG